MLRQWSLIYPDKVTPELSPAYDIVTTRVYMGEETQFALNLSKNKDWYKATFAHFQSWADRARIPWKAILPQLEDTLNKTRTLWPKALDELPMNNLHKQKLKEHLQLLDTDFRIRW